MEIFWSNRIWDLFIDSFYAKNRLDWEDLFHEKTINGTTLMCCHWTIIASRRFLNPDGKWYGY